MTKLIAVLVGLAVVFACSSAWAGWGYLAPGPAVVYRPFAPAVTYYSPVVPMAPLPVVTASPVLTPEAVVYPGAVMYPAPAVVPARFYYRAARPFVRVWLP
jgi:hypothetical protein